MATYLSIYNDIADQMDDTNLTSGTFATATGAHVRRRKAAINRASLKVWRKFNKRNEDAETESTINLTSGTNFVAIPAAIRIVQEVKIDTDDPPLRILPWPEWSSIYQPSVITDEGYPGVCAIYKRRIYFHPTPDSDYTGQVRGLGGHTDLSAYDDEPVLDSEFHDVIYAYALADEMIYEGNPNAMIKLQEAEELFKEAKRRQRAHFEIAPRWRTEGEFWRGEYWRANS